MSSSAASRNTGGAKNDILLVCSVGPNKKNAMQTKSVGHPAVIVTRKVHKMK